MCCANGPPLAKTLGPGRDSTRNGKNHITKGPVVSSLYTTHQAPAYLRPLEDELASDRRFTYWHAPEIMCRACAPRFQ